MLKLQLAGAYHPITGILQAPVFFFRLFNACRLRKKLFSHLFNGGAMIVQKASIYFGWFICRSCIQKKSHVDTKIDAENDFQGPEGSGKNSILTLQGHFLNLGPVGQSATESSKSVRPWTRNTWGHRLDPNPTQIHAVFKCNLNFTFGQSVLIWCVSTWIFLK